MMLGTILAGEAIRLGVGQVGGGVRGEVSPGVGAAGLTPGGGLRRSMMVVDALRQHGGQDVEQRRPPTTPSHASTLPFPANHA
jgi:hypothetical protein